MSEVNPTVVALVERELKKDRTLRSKQLQEKARQIDSSVAKLSGRQFHAQYALQVRRRLFASASQIAGEPDESKESAVSEGSAKKLLVASYNERRAALDAALTSAFDRALAADSIARVNELFSDIDRRVRQLETFLE